MRSSSGFLTKLSCLTTLVFSMASLGGCERYKLDRQMDELCKKDGGIKVYEPVRLSGSDYEAVFNYVIKKKSMEEYYGPNYRFVQRLDYIVGKNADPDKGEGRLSRAYSAIYRRSDSHLLGEQIQYFRRGGDGFTFGFHPSGNACPRFEVGLAHSVFAREP